RRGRIGLAWAGLAALVGMVAIVAGMVLVSFTVVTDAAMGAMLLAALSPLVGMIASMCGLAAILVKLPIATATRRFTIHARAAGPAAGPLVIDDVQLTIEPPAGRESVLLVALRDVRADGECIRLAWSDGDRTITRTYLMGGTPNTPEGRKQQ